DPLRPGAGGGGPEPRRASRPRVPGGHAGRHQAGRGGRGDLRVRHLLRQLHALALPHLLPAHAAADRAVRLPQVLVRSHRRRRLRGRHRRGAGGRARHRARPGPRGVHRLLMRPVSLAEIESLAIGAWILGTGGGGSPYLALLNMRRLYRAGTVVQLMDPMDLADDALVAIVARAESWKWMERLSRTACVAVGSIAATCKAPRTGKEVKECGILSTTTKAMRLGQAVQAARRAHRDPVQAVIDIERGLRLFTGKVQDVARRATEGFLRGTATLEGLDADRGHAFRLAFQNEFAVGWLDGQVRVTTP